MEQRERCSVVFLIHRSASPSSGSDCSNTSGLSAVPNTYSTSYNLLAAFPPVFFSSGSSQSRGPRRCERRAHLNRIIDLFPECRHRRAASKEVERRQYVRVALVEVEGSKKSVSSTPTTKKKNEKTSERMTDLFQESYSQVRLERCLLSFFFLRWSSVSGGTLLSEDAGQESGQGV